MKDFQEHIDEQNLPQKDHRWKALKPEKASFQKVWKVLSRYSLLIVVGLAALSITFLRFQGQSVWESLRGTPLPSFSLEDSLTPKALPKKTEVYDQVLAEEARKQRHQGQITRPNWIGYVTTDKVQKPADTLRVAPDTLSITSPTTSRPRVLPRIRTKARPKLKAGTDVPAQVVHAPDSQTSLPADFFRPVRVSASPISGSFIRCVVDGDQEVKSNDRIRLRLQEPMSLNGQTIPAHTLIYGEVRLSQNRLHITIPRIGPQLASLSVHDHTYHSGILLDDHHDPIQEATQTTVYRHGTRSLGLLPNVASELGRNLLQRSRNQSPSVFLPDGFPLFLHLKNSPNP